MAGILDAIVARGFDPNYGAVARNVRNTNETLADRYARTDILDRRTDIAEEYARQRGAAFETVEKERARMEQDRADLTEAVRLSRDTSLSPEAEAMTGELSRFQSYADSLPEERQETAGRMFSRGLGNTIETQQDTLADRQKKAADLFYGTDAGRNQALVETFGGQSGYRLLTPQEVESQGLDPERSWQVSLAGDDRGKISQVGGAGTSVSVDIGNEPDKLSEETFKQFVKDGAEISAASDAARSTKAQIQRFRMLQSQVASGMFANTELDITKAARALGLNDFNPDMNVPAAEAMRAMGVDFAMSKVQQTKGAISNKEMELFIASAAGLGNTPEGNAMILDLTDRIVDRQIEIDKLRADFLSRYPVGHPERNNVPSLWRKELNEYHDANPIFSDDEISALYGGAGMNADFGSAEGFEIGDTGTGAGGIRVIVKEVNGAPRWVKVN